jgi:hypothetical protein
MNKQKEHFMKILTNSISILAIISLLSTLICGLWIGQQPSVDPSSISFHKSIAILSIVLSVIALSLAIFKK